jgi:phosphodiesterase/alkaline phosphatase D-like protein
VTLENLLPATQYYYQVGDPDWLYSFTTFSFRSAPALPAPANDIFHFITYGDMGGSNAADPELYWLLQVAHEHDADVILHIGDISYADAYQPEWDVFMQKIEPVAAQIPYMTTAGLSLHIHT